MDLFKRQLNNKEKILWTLIVSLLGFNYTLFFCCFISLALDDLFFPQVYFLKFWHSFGKGMGVNLRNIIIYSAGEEVVWRILPLTLISFLLLGLKNRKFANVLLIISILFLSLGFALSHTTRFNIFIQGILGLLWSYLFLKAGGYQQRYFEASLAVIFSHILYNLLVLFNGYFFVKIFGGL
ncbi:MAG: CPBP family glutamic-type intramembrane protease [Patescibacteria group bacterium]|nr:CPBP family glutamic-type intramembrane protease [Patescibacteria group bacterium]